MTAWAVIAAARAVVAALLCALAIWIVVPAPTRLLLPLAVAAPELSPVLLTVSMVVAASGFVLGPSRGSSVVTGLAACAAVLSAIPLARVPGTLSRFDEAMRTAERRGGESGGQTYGVAALFSPPDVPATRVDRAVRVAARGDTALTLDVYRPVSSATPLPIVVQIYGGAWQRGKPGDDEAAARRISGRGYAVFAVDYRHAPEWQWPAQLDDVTGALRWIRTHASEFGADARTIAILGRSSGGQLALSAAYREAPGTVAAAVAYYGPTDLAEGWRRPPRPDPLGGRSILEALLGAPPDRAADAYRDASPLMHVSAASPPTLLIYGARDHVVESRFGRALHERLQAAGVASTYLEIPWAEHAFDAVPGGLSTRIAAHYTLRFLDRVMKR